MNCQCSIAMNVHSFKIINQALSQTNAQRATVLDKRVSPSALRAMCKSAHCMHRTRSQLTRIPGACVHGARVHEVAAECGVTLRPGPRTPLW